MKPPRVVCLLLLVMLFFGLAGCGRGSSGKTRVAFVTNNIDQFWDFAEAGCRKAEQDFGDVEVLVRRPSDATAAQQKENIDALLTLGVKGIAVSVIDPPGQSPFLKEVSEQVPLLTQDNDAPDSGRLCYIGTDNYKAGKAVGKMVKEVMPKGGTVALFVGQMSALNAQQRRQGVLDELADKENVSGTDLGKYKLFSSGSDHHMFTDEKDHNKAKQNADFVLTKVSGNEDLCLVGLWAYNPPMIYQAVKAGNREGKVKIVAFDEAEDTLVGISKGHIHGTVAQQPFEFGYQATKLMRQLAKGDKSGIPAGGIMHIDHKVIKKDDVEQFHKHVDSLKQYLKKS